MTPELYQCQYEKATKCAMDLSCLGCETHVEFAVSVKESDPVIHELNISVKSFEWRREVNMHPGFNLPSEIGRTLAKAEIEFEPNISVENIYAICVNDAWYQGAYRPDELNFLWQELNL